MIRYFWVLRAYALQAGELTGLGDDIFFLDKAEIVRVLQGDDQLDLDQPSSRRLPGLLGAAEVPSADPRHFQPIRVGG